MAVSKPMYSSSYLEEMLECSVCLDIIRDANTLQQCFHSFCKQCIDQLIQKQHNPKPGVNCPICRNFSVKNEIRVNFFINDLAQMHRALKHQNKKPHCDQCSDEQFVEASYKCVDCKANICQNCQINHLKIKLLRGHRILHLNEDTEMIVDHLVFCSAHEDKPIELYCTKCKIPICLKCKATDHDNHKSETIEKTLEKLVPEMENNAEFLSTHLEEIQKSVTDLECKMVETKKSFKDCRADIDKTTAERIREIKDEQKALTEKVNGQEKEQIQMLEDLKMKLESKEKEIENLKKVVRTSLERARQATLLTELVEGGLCAKIEAIQENREKSEVIALNSPKLDVNIIKWNETKHEGLLGKLCSNVSNLVVSMGAVLYKQALFGPRYWNVDFQDIFSKPLKQCHEVINHKDSYRVAIIADEIWVPQYIGNIEIFNIDGSKIRTINIINPASVEQASNGDIFIACHDGGGLHVNSGHEQPVKICDGSFSDICAHRDSMYALEYVTKQIMQFDIANTEGNSKNQWKKTKQIQLINYNNSHTVDTLIVHEQTGGTMLFLVAVHRSNIINKYNDMGQLSQQIVNDNINNPFLCAVNNQSHLLVANYNSKTFNVVDIVTGNTIKTIQSPLTHPSHVKMDKDGFIWVQGNDNGRKTVKYVRQ